MSAAELKRHEEEQQSFKKSRLYRRCHDNHNFLSPGKGGIKDRGRHRPAEIHQNHLSTSPNPHEKRDHIGRRGFNAPTIWSVLQLAHTQHAHTPSRGQAGRQRSRPSTPPPPRPPARRDAAATPRSLHFLQPRSSGVEAKRRKRRGGGGEEERKLQPRC